MTTAAIDSELLNPRIALDQPASHAAACALADSSNGVSGDVVTRSNARGTLAILAVMTLLHAMVLLSFYAPAHAGTDQNGYHVTARLLSQGKGASFRPKSPFTFIGNMMILTETGRIYAKYPPGYPLLAAAARFMGGVNATYLVNPLCTVIACSFSFYLFRTLLGEFASICATLWLSWNPLVLTFANDANSHASTLLCIILGTWGIIAWLQGGAISHGMFGAFCLGYAATIRYSETLLFLPILYAVATPTMSRDSRSRLPLRNGALVLFAWSIPVGCLAMFCWCSFGAPWKTGYAYCSEESGFGWKYFIGDPILHRLGNWETLIVQMNWMGLLMLWPIGLAGLIALVAARPRLGLFIALWVLPQTMLYLCYYWAPTGETTLGYLRFFITTIPALILCAIWMLEGGVRCTRAGGALALGCITALGLCINLWNTLPSLESSLAGRQALAQVSNFVRSHVAGGSSLFLADEPLSNCLDSAGGFDLYNLQLFKNASFASFDRFLDDPAKAGEPDPRQRTRMALYWHLLGETNAHGDAGPKSNEELKRDQDRLLTSLLDAGTPVYFLLKTGQNEDELPDLSRWLATAIAADVSYPNAQVPRAVGAATPVRHAGDTEPYFSNPVTWTLYRIDRRAF